MASRIAYVGSENIGDVLTKANFDKLPGGMIGNLGIVVDSSNQTGTAIVTGLSVTVTAGTARRMLITISCSSVVSIGGGSALTNINIYDVTGAAQLASLFLEPDGNAPATYAGGLLAVWHEPSAGSQTYAFRTTTTHTSGCHVEAASSRPAQITVSDVGPAF